MGRNTTATATATTTTTTTTSRRPTWNLVLRCSVLTLVLILGLKVSLVNDRRELAATATTRTTTTHVLATTTNTPTTTPTTTRQEKNTMASPRTVTTESNRTHRPHSAVRMQELPPRQQQQEPKKVTASATVTSPLKHNHPPEQRQQDLPTSSSLLSSSSSLLQPQDRTGLVKDDTDREKGNHRDHKSQQNIEEKEERLPGQQESGNRTTQLDKKNHQNPSDGTTITTTNNNNNDRTKTNQKTKEKNILVRRRRFPHRPTLHLVGERHSGTNWMARHLKECFGNQVDFLLGFSDWKHWFQAADHRYDSTGAVVVVQFRNVFHWTEAMRFLPYHAPLHYNLEWPDFVTRPWSMTRYGPDVSFQNVTHRTSPANVTCRYGRNKQPFEIIPCQANQTFFVDWNGIPNRRDEAYYELRDDGSGLPFANIFALRRAKIHNFLSMAQFPNVYGFHPTRYEDMVQHGTQDLIRELAHELNVTAQCHPIQGEPRKGARPVPSDLMAYIRSTTTSSRPPHHHPEVVDWDTEALIGYHPQDMMM